MYAMKDDAVPGVVMPTIMTCRLVRSTQAHVDPKTFRFTQKRHPYTGNNNSETSGDDNDAFLHCGDVSGQCTAGMYPVSLRLLSLLRVMNVSPSQKRKRKVVYLHFLHEIFYGSSILAHSSLHLAL